MSGKYSDNRFFFVHYGCCIPTESYVWILVVLFVTTILVLLFCMLATATVRWLYKRRMRKRLQDLKRKYLQDQLKAQEFEAKLNYMAQKNKSTKNDNSKESLPDKFTIFVDPAQNYAHQYSAKKKRNTHNIPQKAAAPTMQAPPLYDRDETPIAQSTLASQSNTNMPNNNRWFYPQKHQKGPLRPLVSDFKASPNPPVLIPPQHAPVHPPPIVIVPTVAQSKSPPKMPDSTQSTSPGPASPKNVVSPIKTKKKSNEKVLAPPSVSTSTGITETTGTTDTSASSGTVGTTGNTDGTTKPTASSDTTQTTSNDSPTVPTSSGAVSPKQGKKSSGEDVKQRVQYGQDDIVSPLEKNEDRTAGAGGRGEWKYYYANSVSSEGKKRAPSTVTKSSTSHRPSSGSWLIDSTGSNRYDGRGSSRCSSIIKTDSSHYKTASPEQFPHGAFGFQQ
ncbi:unnamed protein product [Caenorhabditis sp. 36 PRJEB53466]|nr:unnamed protein product [Caenorhabditis sp. 36 PRJEB53466]